MFTLQAAKGCSFVSQFHKFYLTDYSKHGRTHDRRNQLSPSFVNARQKDSTQVLPSYAGTNNKSKVQNNEECSPKSLDPQEKRTAQISPKAPNTNSFTPLLQRQFRVRNG
ncbi:hypothetical protein F511_39308 [Dorcoceras hygrometricum]|uniref:Uncharacterized protein n=1 Tax=Dorcoceras hygrometricum TaxID=472368 RepID=A0A2Z7AV55_9LAMI|nr:hypothetical protein F511_39308 [Dorcoceras hygrometricum]